jgi:hypothetical protein
MMKSLRKKITVKTPEVEINERKLDKERIYVGDEKNFQVLTPLFTLLFFTLDSALDLSC